MPQHAAPEYEVVSSDAIEPKTINGTAGAGIGAALSTFLIWAADAVWWNGSDLDPDVPLPVSGLISVVVTGACTFAASYYARHVNR